MKEGGKEVVLYLTMNNDNKALDLQHYDEANLPVDARNAVLRQSGGDKSQVNNLDDVNGSSMACWTAAGRRRRG